MPARADLGCSAVDDCRINSIDNLTLDQIVGTAFSALSDRIPSRSDRARFAAGLGDALAGTGPFVKQKSVRTRIALRPIRPMTVNVPPNVPVRKCTTGRLRILDDAPRRNVQFCVTSPVALLKVNRCPVPGDTEFLSQTRAV
jgi:hypothetical protein